ncbi:GNAT family N-acetyltransferase [Paenibacillus sp. GSMTC-2017]|nr:GNAT family N-acetyltransferase [Paenibacillus sp. GSMTC-2017]
MLDEAFRAQYPWYQDRNYFHTCLEQISSGQRVTLIALVDGEIAGCCHLLYESKYPHFQDKNIPEINSLDVFPEYRRNKIASRFFDELELIAANTSEYIGLGVGLYKDYGNAQMMYSKRGYMLDGKGMFYNNVEVSPGQSVIVDDELLVYLVKELR